MSLAVYPKPSPKQRGRPKGLKDPDLKSSRPAKLSPRLMEIIQVERRHNESYSDTILRLLRVKTKELEKARKKVDALEERLTYYTSKYYTPKILIN
jgi:hypothetical protein